VRVRARRRATAAPTRLAEDVSAVLDDGDAPVLVTLGTSAATNAKQVFELMAATLDDLHLRGLFLVGDESNITGRLQNRPGVWPFVPLHLVLPRCRAVVHSASLGTTGAVVESGFPSLAVPLLFDQIWNAYRAAQLGTGLVLRKPSRARARNMMERLVTDEKAPGERACAVGSTRRRARRGRRRRRDRSHPRTARRVTGVKGILKASRSRGRFWY
jgi:UDP:flavonoid glycosyltransferase YjiC (YdhE family)